MVSSFHREQLRPPHVLEELSDQLCTYPKDWLRPPQDFRHYLSVVAKSKLDPTLGISWHIMAM